MLIAELVRHPEKIISHNEKVNLFSIAKTLPKRESHMKSKSKITESSQLG